MCWSIKGKQSLVHVQICSMDSRGKHSSVYIKPNMRTYCTCALMRSLFQCKKQKWSLICTMHHIAAALACHDLSLPKSVLLLIYPYDQSFMEFIYRIKFCKLFTWYLHLNITYLPKFIREIKFLKILFNVFNQKAMPKIANNFWILSPLFVGGYIA